MCLGLNVLMPKVFDVTELNLRTLCSSTCSVSFLAGRFINHKSEIYIEKICPFIFKETQQFFMDRESAFQLYFLAQLQNHLWLLLLLLFCLFSFKQ